MVAERAETRPRLNRSSIADGARARLRVIGDTLQNLVSGLGTNKDKRTHNAYAFVPLQRDQLEAAFRSDWVARKVVSCPPQDETREWRSWYAEKADITLIESVEKALRIQRKLKWARTLARLYGGSVMFLGVDGTGDPSTELNLESVKKDSLKFVHVMANHQVSGGQVIRDVLNPNYGMHETYDLQSSNGQVKVHPSRVIRFIGAEPPDIIENQGWGDSALQAVDDAVKDVGMCSGGLAQLIWEMKIDIVKLPHFMSQVSQQDYKDLLIERFQLANMSKSIINTLLLDKEEEWTRINTSLTGAPDMLKLYLLIASGAADIPATRMLGQSPEGMNATGESDIRNYYDRISSDQNTELSPTIETLDEVIVRSGIGSRPEDIYYEWNPLWQLSEKEMADRDKTKADTYKIDIDTGLLPQEVMAQARVNQLIEDGVYPGLDQLMEDVDLEEHLSQLNERNPEVIAAEEARARMAANQNDPAAPGVEDTPPPRRTAADWGYGLAKPGETKRRRAMKRRIQRDHGNPDDPNYPHGGGGGGGGGEHEHPSAAGGGSAHQDAIKAALEKTPVGNDMERTALRALMNHPDTSPSDRQLLKDKIAQAYAVHINKLASQGYAHKAEKLTKSLKNMGYDPEKLGVKGLGTAKVEPTKVASVSAPKAESASGGAGHYGMTQDELTSLKGYTGSHYKSLNDALRSGMMTETQYGHVNRINSALSKLPAYKGVVRRGINANLTDRYKVGMIVEERSFTSTTTNSSASFGSSTGTKYEIESVSGRAVKSFSQHPSENEVLFQTGTRFKVIGVTGNTVRMAEVGRL